MNSSQRWMLQGTLSLAVVLAVGAEARAQNLETPGAAAAEPAPTAPASAGGPTGFGDGGQFVLSVENLFGYNWDHESLGNGSGTSSTFSVLGNPFAVGAYPYDWPRLGFDYFLTKSVSGGIAVAFARNTAGNSSTNAFELAPRVGYGMMVGPWLGVWPRAGVTYINATGTSYLGVSFDLTAMAVVSPHLAITFAPVVNVGVSGSAKQANGTNVDVKYTTVGVQFGLAIPF